MKKTIGIITLLVMSASIFADEMSEAKTEVQIIESDVTTTNADPAIMPEKSGFSHGSVVRSAFTRNIDEREPTENLEKLTNDNGQVKFFTELRDMNGQTAVHRWEYEGKVVAEIKFNVKGPRWRVWSSKSFVPQWTGDWKVSVLNGAGEIISEKNLSYDMAAAPASSNTEMPAATMETMQ